MCSNCKLKLLSTFPSPSGGEFRPVPRCSLVLRYAGLPGCRGDQDRPGQAVGEAVLRAGPRAREHLPVLHRGVAEQGQHVC